LAAAAAASADDAAAAAAETARLERRGLVKQRYLERAALFERARQAEPAGALCCSVFSRAPFFTDHRIHDPILLAARDAA
jgi:hypothetical protein